MRFLAFVFLAFALAGCAEVTTFRNPDGTTYYYVDCENSMRVVETCSFAAKRTCPNGYTQVPVTVLHTASEDPVYMRCLEERRDEEEATGKSGAPCVRTYRREGFFACK